MLARWVGTERNIPFRTVQRLGIDCASWEAFYKPIVVDKAKCLTDEPERDWGMKKLLMCGAAALVLASCGGKASSPADVDAALVQLSLKDSGSGRVEFEDKSVSGSDATFKNVKIRTSDFAEDDASVDTAVDDESIGVEIDADRRNETRRSQVGRCGQS